MDKLGKELLDFLSADPLKDARKELYNLLETNSDEINVYYLVSLFNPSIQLDKIDKYLNLN